MATEILATGSTVGSNSSDLTVVAGTPANVCLKGLVGPDARCFYFLKDDASAYNYLGEINSPNPEVVLTAPGVYRFKRIAGTCGVFTG